MINSREKHMKTQYPYISKSENQQTFLTPLLSLEANGLLSRCRTVLVSNSSLETPCDHSTGRWQFGAKCSQVHYIGRTSCLVDQMSQYTCNCAFCTHLFCWPQSPRVSGNGLRLNSRIIPLSPGNSPNHPTTSTTSLFVSLCCYYC
jgi:hypothetical protein